jgi:hypothetical protein
MPDFCVKRIVERANTTPEHLDGAILKASINFAPMRRLVAPLKKTTKLSPPHLVAPQIFPHSTITGSEGTRQISNFAMQNVFEVQNTLGWNSDPFACGSVSNINEHVRSFGGWPDGK